MLSTKRFLRYWTVFSLDSISYFSFYCQLYVLDKKLEEIYQNISWIDVLGQINKFDWEKRLIAEMNNQSNLAKSIFGLGEFKFVQMKAPPFPKGAN